MRRTARRGWIHDGVPARWCFQSLRPRLNRLEIDERGISSTGVTVSQSSAVRTACFRLKEPRSIDGANHARSGIPRSARKPGR